MNIFYLDNDPVKCAEMHVDRHVCKMVIEYAQLLSTAHRVLDGEMYLGKTTNNRNIKRWRLPDEREERLMKPTMMNHPSAIWTRESIQHYKWLCELGKSLCREYTHRYLKEHSCERHIHWLEANPPRLGAGWRQPPQAMPDEYKKGDSVAAYRAYYVGAKREFLTYKRRNTPHWVAKI